MKQIVKIASVLFTLFILTAASVILYFHQNIKPILISEINNTLDVKVAVEEITISGFRYFPNLGIELAHVSIDESTSYYKEKLLIADELNLFIDIFKLYKGEYVIDKVVLRGGKLRIADLNYGTNYDITKPRTEDGTAVSFEIKDLKLIQCDIMYEHRPSKFKCNTYTPLSTIALKYIEKTLNVSIVAELNKTDAVSGSEKYVVEKDLKINTKIAINPEEQIATIAPSDLQIQEVKLKTEGRVDYSQTSAVDIRFSNANTTAQSLFSILPDHFSSSLDNIDLTGHVVIDGFLKGKTYGTNDPALGCNYTFKKAKLGVKGQDLKLSEVDAKGDLSIPNLGNLSGAKATCKLQNAAINNAAIMGDIEVTNFERPIIKWDGTAKLDVAFILGLMDSAVFDAKSGVISIDGKLKLTYDIQKGAPVPNSLRYAGSILLENLSGTLKKPKIDIRNVDLNISADNQKMVVKSARFSYNNTTGTLKGYIEDYISLLNEKSNAKLVGQLAVDNFTMNELYNTAAFSTASNSSVNVDLLPIKLSLMTTLTNFRFNEFIANKMHGQLLSNRISIRMPKCEIDALGGKTVANIAIKKWGEDHLLNINLDLKNINISELFKQFNNFEQSEITDKNLKGTLNGNIVAKIILDKTYTPVFPKLHAKVNAVIDDGALIGYKPLTELSAFAKIDDLKNVKFKSLKNTIEIFDQTIFIPRMRIENNALNLEIEGTHAFDNYMQYSISLNVAELLATKANWIARKAEKRVDKNKDGGLTAYILMEGTPDKLKIRYDKSTVKENVKEEFKEEKKKFIRALKGEGTSEEETSNAKNYDDVWDE